MRIVAISDTHHRYRADNEYYKELKIAEGDVLVHAGDATMQGSVKEITAFNDWLGRQSHKHKIVVPGNHDLMFESDPTFAVSLMTNAKVLMDAGVEVDGVKIWGSPWQPWFYDWAFNLPRGKKLAEKWALIPEGTDLLITHGPPMGFGDRVPPRDWSVSKDWDPNRDRSERVGCVDLADRIKAIKPKWHVFGHIHCDPGVFKDEHTSYINASTCDHTYVHANPAIVIDTETGIVKAEEYVNLGNLPVE